MASAATPKLDVERILFGWFPTYRSNSPLTPAFDRVLSVGDASAVQSPISFGGFCAMLRHLPRYTRGLDAALREDRLRRDDLARLAPYLPNLGTAWLSVSAMTARATQDNGAAVAPLGARAQLGADEPYTLVNELLSGNFKVMANLPRQEALVFFRDVTRLGTLAAVLAGQTATMAPILPRVMVELVEPLELAEFTFHFTMLGLYTLLHAACRTAQIKPANFRQQSYLDALAFGSGLEAVDGGSLPPVEPLPATSVGQRR